MHLRLAVAAYTFAFSLTMLGATDPDQLLAAADRFADLGNNVAARDLYAQAEKAFAAQNNRTKMLYARFGRLRRDVETGSYDAYLKEVEESLAEPTVQQTPRLKIRGLALKAQINMNLNSAAARRDWEAVELLANEISDVKWANRAQGQLGIVAGIEGDYATALARLVSAITKAEQIDDTSAVIYFKTFLANGMTANNRAAQAIGLYDSAIALGTRSPESGYPILPIIGKARALRALQKHTEALATIDDALSRARADNVLGAQTELLVLRGLSARDTSNWSLAEASFREAAEIARSASLPRMVAAAQAGLVDVYRARKDWPAARRAADAAISAVRRPHEIYDLPQHLARKAEVETEIGNLKEADNLYSEANGVIEGMLVNMPGSPAKSSLIATMSRVYTGQFRLAVDQMQDLSKAFAVVERARGRSISDSLRLGAKRSANSADEAELRISSIQRQIRTSRSAVELKSLLSELERAEIQLSGVESDRNRQDLQRMALLGRRPASRAAVQQILNPAETLIEFVLDEPDSFCLEIRHESSRLHRIDGRRKLESAVDTYVAAITKKQDGTQEARYLYAQLLRCTSDSAARRIIIVPDGKLHVVPYAALIDARGNYAVESRTFSLSPSANVLHVVRSRSVRGVGLYPFLGIASTAASTDDRSPDTSARRGFFDLQGASFRPLPFAREEVSAAAREMGPGSVVLAGGDSTEASLKTKNLADYRVLHFAAHAVASDKDPERAGIVLEPGSDNEDGLWQPREIRRQALTADLVTLSACQTALGKLEGQEGIANLARTFILAGAAAVAASLWMVDDRSTATLMAGFYAHLRRGQTVSDALRSAQMDMLSQFGKGLAPLYWAAFSVIGDGTKTILAKTSSADGQRTRTRLR